jgi:hypothetical protein
MARLRFLVAALCVLMMAGCFFIDQGLPANTISFTLDGVEHAYSLSIGPASHAWGRGMVGQFLPPEAYLITASATVGDAMNYTNTIEIDIGSESDYYIDVYIYDEGGDNLYFYLGAADRNLLEHIIVNLDAEGEQMQGVFPGTYTYVNGSTHTLKNLAFSVDRLADYYYPTAE